MRNSSDAHPDATRAEGFLGTAGPDATRQEIPLGPTGAGVTQQEQPFGTPEAGATRQEIPLGVPNPNTTRTESILPTTGPQDAGYFRLPPKLQADYDLIREISAGGQGVVLLVRERRTGTEKAVKLYHGTPHIDRDTLATLERSTLADHVVPLVCDSDGGRTWEVMEYFPLGDLIEWVRRQGGGALPTEQVRPVLIELAEAIDHIHELEVVHRDLKPANVLVRRDQPVDCVLTDFGIARTQIGTNMYTRAGGSLTYMPPEALYGRVSYAGDWWALGAIIWELLVGRPLFSAPNGELLLDGVIHDQLIQRKWHVEPIADERWQLLLRGLLTAEPESRWRAAQVRGWLAGESPEAAWLGTGPATLPDEPSGGFGYRGHNHIARATLAAALAEDWEDALDLVQSSRGIDLRHWLSTTSIGDRAEELLTETRKGEVPPQRGVVQLQVLLAPDVAPVFNGVRLDTAGFNAVIRAAGTGESWALEWIRELRRQNILTAAGQVPALVQAEGKLNRWWRQLKATRAALENDAEIEAHLGEAESVLEGPLLAAALDESHEQRLLAQEQKQVRSLDSTMPQVLRDQAGASLPLVARAASLSRAVQQVLEEAERERRAAEAARAAEKRARDRERAREERGRQWRQARTYAVEVTWRRLGLAAVLVIVMGIFGMVSGLPFSVAFLPYVVPLAISLALAAGVDLLLWGKPGISAGSVLAYAALVALAIRDFVPAMLDTVTYEPRAIAMIPIYVAGAYAVGRILEWLVRLIPGTGQSGAFPGGAYVLPILAIVAVGALYWVVQSGRGEMDLFIEYPASVQEMIRPVRSAVPLLEQITLAQLFGLAWVLMATVAVPWTGIPRAVRKTGLLVVNLLAVLIILAGITFLPLGLLWGLLIVPLGFAFVAIDGGRR